MSTIEQQVIKLIQEYAVNGDVEITEDTRLFRLSWNDITKERFFYQKEDEKRD